MLKNVEQTVECLYSIPVCEHLKSIFKIPGRLLWHHEKMLTFEIES